MSRRFHVSSSLNRHSIRVHGLDWTRMGAARGIAGSTAPEVEGCFLGTDYDVDFFVRINNTGGPVDVWAVDDVDEELLVTVNGFDYLPRTVPASSLTLLQTEAHAAPVALPVGRRHDQGKRRRTR